MKSSIMFIAVGIIMQTFIFGTIKSELESNIMTMQSNIHFYMNNIKQINGIGIYRDSIELKNIQIASNNIESTIETIIVTADDIGGFDGYYSAYYDKINKELI